MKTQRFLAAVVLALWGCAGGEGQNVPGENEECSEPGMTTCGLATSGQDAVLQCSLLHKWEASQVCTGECTVAADGATCVGGGLPDVVEDSGLEDLADLQGIELVELVDVVPDEAPADEVEPPDIQVEFKDLMPDMTPPWVKSTTPTDQEMGVALPFVVRIEFTEPMYEPTVGDKTVLMFDAGGKNVTVEYSWEDEKKSILLMTPKGAVFPASPYTVRLEPLIKDLAGNMLGNNYQFTFYTAATQPVGLHTDLAASFAPLIYQATNDEAPQYDYLTRFDLDGDWVAEDTVDYVKTNAVKFEGYVHFSVAETKSHYFITYVFFYPYRFAESEGGRFGNDVSGAVVLVRKSDNQPVAVETYFKPQGADERSFSFITDDSGFDTGGTFTDFKFDGKYPREDLFPNGHYVAYLSARKHESCLWLDENNGFLDGCQLNAGIKAQMKRVEYKYKGGEVTALTKTGGKFPQQADDVGYGLVHLLQSWWPRRGDVGVDKMWASEFDYEPFTSTLFKNRPDLSTKIPSVFVDPIGNDDGRPPWAWKHNPQNGASFYDLPRGVWFLDPAVHFKQRHDQKNLWPGWDDAGKTGWSLEYCFNPYFNLDFRGVWAECSQKQ